MGLVEPGERIQPTPIAIGTGAEAAVRTGARRRAGVEQLEAVVGVAEPDEADEQEHEPSSEDRPERPDNATGTGYHHGDGGQHEARDGIEDQLSEKIEHGLTPGE